MSTNTKIIKNTIEKFIKTSEKTMDNVQKMIKKSKKIINRTIDNNYISIGINLLLISYIVFILPAFSDTIINIIDNIFVRIFIGFLILILAVNNPTVSLILLICLVVTLQLANKSRLEMTKDKFTNLTPAPISEEEARKIK